MQLEFSLTSCEIGGNLNCEVIYTFLSICHVHGSPYVDAIKKEGGIGCCNGCAACMLSHLRETVLHAEFMIRIYKIAFHYQPITAH